MLREFRNNARILTSFSATGVLALAVDGCIPVDVRLVRGAREQHRFASPSRTDLKDIAVLVIVVRDHVEHEHAGDVELLVRDALAQMAGSEAVGGKFFAGEVDEPDVAREIELAEDWRG